MYSECSKFARNYVNFYEKNTTQKEKRPVTFNQPIINEKLPYFDEIGIR